MLEIHQSNTDCMFVDYDGSDATLYFAGKNSAADCFIGQFENGYTDVTNSISCPFKTKYYDFGAPEISKMPRVWYIDAENMQGSTSMEVYIDDLNLAKSSFSVLPTIDDCLVSNTDNTESIIAGSSAATLTNLKWTVNLSDELAAVSLGRGLVGSRIQFGATLVASGAQLKIHMIGFEWIERNKLKRKYGA